MDVNTARDRAIQTDTQRDRGASHGGVHLSSPLGQQAEVEVQAELTPHGQQGAGGTPLEHRQLLQLLLLVEEHQQVAVQKPGHGPPGRISTSTAMGYLSLHIVTYTSHVASIELDWTGLEFC